MKVKLSAAVAAGILVVLAFVLSAGPTVEAGRGLDQAPASEQGGAVLGDDRWTPLGGPSAPGGQVLGLAVPASAPGTVYAAVSTSGVGGEIGPSTIYRSTDGAGSWTAVLQAANQVNCLAAAGSTIYAGAYQHTAEEVPAIYVSRDGGDTWETPFSLEGRGVFLDAAVDPGNPDRAILAGLRYDEDLRQSGMVYGTADGGVTWSLLLQVTVPDQKAACTAVLISPHDPDLMLAACRGDGEEDTHIYRSTDGGDLWADAFTLTGVHLSSFVAHAGDPQVFYAASSALPPTWAWGPRQVYRSGDAGQTWDQVLDGCGGPLAFEPPATVYTYCGFEMWASSSEGDPGTWAKVGGVPDVGFRLAIDLGVSPAALYAGERSAGVALSTDGGAGWDQANHGLLSLVAPRDIDVGPADPDTLFVAAAENGGWRSDDAGATWTQVIGGGPIAGPWAFEIQPGDSDVVYAGVTSAESATILRSADGGLTFTGVYTPPYGENIYAVEAAPSNPLMVYAAGAAWGDPGGWGVGLRSQNGGLTWSEVFAAPIESTFNALAVSPLDDQVALMGGYDRSSGSSIGVIYRTLDGGDSWEQVFAEEGHEAVVSIVIDDEDPNVIYAGGGAAWWAAKSTDGGDTWTPINDAGGVLAIDPNDHNRIYLGGWGLIQESPDGGATWSGWDGSLNQGAPMAGPGALTVDTGLPVQALYAGWTGVWSYTRLAPVVGDRYVATSGEDTLNNCTGPDTPCRTVGHALGLADPGETVRVAGGTYLENLTIGKSVTVEGGYSGPPGWSRDLGAYETVLDGSADPAIAGAWDGAAVGLPNVFWDADAGLYRMYYTGWSGIWPNSVGLATSPDAVTWTRYAGNPVLVGDNQTWEGVTVDDPYVRAEGGTYKIWYDNYTSIGYATSDDGITWTKHPTPVFGPNSNPLAWDSAAVKGPSIIKPGAQYLMAYTGRDDSGVWQIGLATSSDGITWVRRGDPVLGPGQPGAWDEGGAYRADLAYVGGVYHLLYTGLPSRRIGVATSPDGTAWTKYAGNPVLPGGDPWESGAGYGAGHFSFGGEWKAWYGATGEGGVYAIGLATSSDGFVWTPDFAHNPVLTPGSPGDVQGAPVVRIYTPQKGVLAGVSDRPERLEAPAVAAARPEQVQVVLDGLTLTNGTYWYGGALSVASGAVTLQSVRIIDNQALNDGGGIWVAGGSTAGIITSEILDNSALGLGGGLYNAGTVDLSRSTLLGNQAAYGGGLHNDGGVLDLLNCTLTANAATSRGGAIDNAAAGRLDLLNCTLFGNTAPSGGGVAIVDGTARAWNVILAGNGGAACDGTWSDGTNNLATDATCGSPCTQVSLEELRLGDLTGSPAYFPLRLWSAAIDAGTTGFCTEVDEPGNVRPQDGDGDGVAVCDVGAYEAPTIVLRRVYLPLVLRKGP